MQHAQASSELSCIQCQRCVHLLLFQTNTNIFLLSFIEFDEFDSTFFFISSLKVTDGRFYLAECSGFKISCDLSVKGLSYVLLEYNCWFTSPLYLILQQWFRMNSQCYGQVKPANQVSTELLGLLFYNPSSPWIYPLLNLARRGSLLIQVWSGSAGSYI